MARTPKRIKPVVFTFTYRGERYYSDERVSQACFADLIGVDPSVVSRLISDDVLSPESTCGQWLVVYTATLRAQARMRGA